MHKKRVFITGIGVLSPFGISKEQFWQNLFKGNSAFVPITLFDTRDLKVNIGGEITNFNPKEIIGDKGLMDLDRSTLLFLCAAKLVLNDAHLEVNQTNADRIGITVGTTFGNLHSFSKFDRQALTEGPRYANPSVFPSTVGNAAASRAGIRYQIRGFNTTVSTGMCAGLDAVSYSRDAIELDKADVVLAGCVEDLSFQTFMGFYKLKYMAGLKGEFDKPLCCPFDKRRNGIILSEGAAAFIIKESGSIEKTEEVYGEVIGTGECFDPAKYYKYSYKGEGMKQAMRCALEDADLSIRDIDCIFANANSTKEGDYIESKAIKEVFGRYAYSIPVTAVKSMIGESVSVSGGFQLAAALGALNKGLIPPTINFEEKDSDCDLDYVPNKAREKDLSCVMINSFSPAGANTSVILGKWKDKKVKSNYSGR